MIKIPNLIFLPAFLERFLLRVYRLIVPFLLIILSFILFYMPWGNYLGWNVMFDVPSILLFCLFFVRRKYINISIFFVVACFFEAEYHIPFLELILFYGIFGFLLYLLLKIRDYHFTHYFTLMSVYVVCYFLTSLIFQTVIFEEYDLKYAFEQWMGTVVIYPIFFGLFYRGIIQNSKNMLLYEI